MESFYYYTGLVVVICITIFLASAIIIFTIGKSYDYFSNTKILIEYLYNRKEFLKYKEKRKEEESNKDKNVFEDNYLDFDMDDPITKKY